jgi:hypothetical protein
MRSAHWRVGLALLLALGVLGCSNRVRAAHHELLGTWVTKTDTGKEELILRDDNSYVQSFLSPTKQFTNRGTWKTSNLFLDGTELELTRANISEDEKSDRYGDLFLQVHRKDGKVKLARNESADWYYERVP